MAIDFSHRGIRGNIFSYIINMFVMEHINVGSKTNACSYNEFATTCAIFITAGLL